MKGRRECIKATKEEEEETKRELARCERRERESERGKGKRTVKERFIIRDVHCKEDGENRPLENEKSVRGEGE